MARALLVFKENAEKVRAMAEREARNAARAEKAAARNSSPTIRQDHEIVDCLVGFHRTAKASARSTATADRSQHRSRQAAAPEEASRPMYSRWRPRRKSDIFGRTRLAGAWGIRTHGDRMRSISLHHQRPCRRIVEGRGLHRRDRSI